MTEPDNSVGNLDKPQRPPKRSFAFCVDSIKEGIRRMTGERRPTRGRCTLDNAPQNQRRVTVQGGLVVGVKRKKEGGGGTCNGHQSSFELHLKALPLLDPVDRTVGWVATQTTPPQEEVCRDMFHELPQRGSIAPRPCPAEPPHAAEAPPTPGHSLHTPGYETSVSRCESDRGTLGRGTPPQREVGYPRLDELFRQLQMRRGQPFLPKERHRIVKEGEGLSSYHLLNVSSSQVPGYPPGITPDLLPFLTPPHQHKVPAALVHKNSAYLNQGTAAVNPLPQTGALDYVCEWQGCRMKLQSARDLFTHLEEEHITHTAPHSNHSIRGRGNPTFCCQWRDCPEAQRGFPARYKLLLHIQHVHCRERVQKPAKADNALSRPTSTQHRNTDTQYKHTDTQHRHTSTQYKHTNIQYRHTITRTHRGPPSRQTSTHNKNSRLWTHTGTDIPPQLVTTRMIGYSRHQPHDHQEHEDGGLQSHDPNNQSHDIRTQQLHERRPNR